MTGQALHTNEAASWLTDAIMSFNYVPPNHSGAVTLKLELILMGYVTGEALPTNGATTWLIDAIMSFNYVPPNQSMEISFVISLSSTAFSPFSKPLPCGDMDLTIMWS